MKFTYAFSNNTIDILDFTNPALKDDKIALLDNMSIDYEYPKIFFMVLKKAHDELIRLKYTKVVQYVSLDDWYSILNKNNKWKLIEVNHKEKTGLIICDINDLIDCLVNAFDL
jgi:hypothetical protein